MKNFKKILEKINKLSDEERFLLKEAIQYIYKNKESKELKIKR